MDQWLQIDPEILAEVVNHFKPHSCQAISDMDTPVDCANKRLTKAVNRTISLLKDYLEKLDPKSVSLLWAFLFWYILLYFSLFYRRCFINHYNCEHSYFEMSSFLQHCSTFSSLVGGYSSFHRTKCAEELGTQESAAGKIYSLILSRG